MNYFSKNLFREFVNKLNHDEKKSFYRQIEDETGASERNIRLWHAGRGNPTSFRKRKIDQIAVSMGYDPIYDLYIPKPSNENNLSKTPSVDSSTHATNDKQV